MTGSAGTAPSDDIAGVPPASPWLERAAAEIVRGRHLVVHGNVHDPVRWMARHVPVRQALTEVFELLGYSVIGYYDQVDGLSSARASGADNLSRVLSAAARPATAGRPPNGPGMLTRDRLSPASPGTEAPGTGRRPGERAPTPGEPGTEARPRGRAGQADAQMAAALGSAAPPQYERPADALAAIRRGLAQDQMPAAFIVDFAELLFLDPQHVDRNDRQLLAVAKKAMLEAAYCGDLRNLLVLISGDLGNVPEWLYRDEPFIQPVEAMRPGFDERRAYLHGVSGRFLGGARAASAAVGESVRVLANLSEGMSITELDGLWRTSKWEEIPVTQPRELVTRAIFGRRQDPWTRLAERIPGAPGFLGRRVIGQPAAVERVCRTLTAATLGIDFVADPHSVEARPKGVFFFVGPTGVGKTELARALSEFVYDDETALARFDMSTFAEAHAAERFTGAPPGYVGHERGGELTNRVRQRPFSVLLFDEIEKAHPSVFDKFLQILDDGRLTDGLGRTSYFSQTLIIFTSNLGAASIYDRVREGSLPGYQDVASHFEESVRGHFTNELNRPELLGRIGNGIVAFDVLRPEHVDAIATKFLRQLAATAERNGVQLDVDEASVLAVAQRGMTDPAAGALGGRRIRDVLDRAVREPLVDHLRTGARRGRFRVTVPPGAAVAEITPLDAVPAVPLPPQVG